MPAARTRAHGPTGRRRRPDRPREPLRTPSPPRLAEGERLPEGRVRAPSSRPALTTSGPFCGTSTRGRRSAAPPASRRDCRRRSRPPRCGSRAQPASRPLVPREAGRVAQRAHPARQPAERPVKFAPNAAPPEQEPVGRVADRCVPRAARCRFRGRSLRVVRRPPIPHCSRHVEQIARLNRRRRPARRERAAAARFQPSAIERPGSPACSPAARTRPSPRRARPARGPSTSTIRSARTRRSLLTPPKG